MLGTRRRAILATWTERSPIRSSSLTIRSAETTTRRSPATGCWSESSAKALSSTRSRLASMAWSALITSSAIAASPVSRAAVARLTAVSTWPHMSARSMKIGVELVMEGFTHGRSLGRPETPRAV